MLQATFQGSVTFRIKSAQLIHSCICLHGVHGEFENFCIVYVAPGLCMQHVHDCYMHLHASNHWPELLPLLAKTYKFFVYTGTYALLDNQNTQ